MKAISLFSVVMLAVLGFGCNADKGKGEIILEIKHTISGQPLTLNEMKYTNLAGNLYSVSKLQYYISNVVLVHEDGHEEPTSLAPTYISATNLTNDVFLKVIPSGTYTQIKFLIGMDSNTNKSFGLPSNPENLEMGWPDMMGGGYHFFKLEGNFKHPNDSNHGFAVHTGTNPALTTHAPVACQIKVEKDANTRVVLEMDVNSWFESPHTFDLINDGFYTMGIAPLMRKIADNGQNVFRIK